MVVEKCILFRLTKERGQIEGCIICENNSLKNKAISYSSSKFNTSEDVDYTIETFKKIQTKLQAGEYNTEDVVETVS